MTYMYRKLQFLDIPMAYRPSNKYSLSVYNEGYRWWNKSTIEAGQIPVLFIPGSQGSAKQIRSLASLMQNKTEMRYADFSFRFFAVDFDEEITFFNGNIINRQLDYVMHAVRKIQSMMRVKRKIVLVGHSYGGMISLLMTIHPDFQNDIDLVIVKGAPINQQPVVVDWLSMRLNRFLVNQWNLLQSTDLKHIGVVAYTGGLRDYLIQDEWSAMRNITHRPLWAIDGVSDLGADHLAILWCNEFVRHVSRVLYSYAESLDKLTGRQVVDNFYKNEVDRDIKRANLISHIREVPTKEIKLGEKYEDLRINKNNTHFSSNPNDSKSFQ
uniref:GPI inositol-deacylase n=1 Tax=Caenorhabditis tropicalis TaxID=1561998 RepID=A0A1I7T678_9PELO